MISLAHKKRWKKEKRKSRFEIKNSFFQWFLIAGFRNSKRKTVRVRDAYHDKLCALIGPRWLFSTKPTKLDERQFKITSSCLVISWKRKNNFRMTEKRLGNMTTIYVWFTIWVINGRQIYWSRILTPEQNHCKHDSLCFLFLSCSSKRHQNKECLGYLRKIVCTFSICAKKLNFQL